MTFLWDANAEDQLVDMLFDTNLSRREMAKEIGCNELDVTMRIRDLQLGWVRRQGGHVSRGQAALTSIMRKLLPGERIICEEYLPEKLRLDVYCPKYKLAAEYHGRQHFYYVEHFHKDIDGFNAMRQRDARKVELCKELGIALVVLRFCDMLSEELVYERMLQALKEGPAIVPKVQQYTIKSNPYYAKQMERQREYRRLQYRKLKNRRG